MRRMRSRGSGGGGSSTSGGSGGGGGRARGGRREIRRIRRGRNHRRGSFSGSSFGRRVPVKRSETILASLSACVSELQEAVVTVSSHRRDRSARVFVGVAICCVATATTATDEVPVPISSLVVYHLGDGLTPATMASTPHACTAIETGGAAANAAAASTRVSLTSGHLLLYIISI